MAYATTSELKSRLSISDSVDDTLLGDAIDVASREVEQYTHRVFTASSPSTARVFEAEDWWELDFGDYCDLTTLVSIKTDADGDGVFETTWTASDYELYPINPTAFPEDRPYEGLRAIGTLTLPVPARIGATRRHLVQVTGTWGWSATPASVKDAVLSLAAEGFKSKDSPFGVAGVADFGLIRIGSNARVTRLLQPYRRGTGAVLVG